MENLFNKSSKIKEYLVEFYSDKNLFIPFPAVMINHKGNDFINTVHSFNRVLNDVFEDDKVNLQKVFESSIDVEIDKDYDTFFNFASGPFKVRNNLHLTLIRQEKKNYKIPIEISRLSNKNIFVSNFYKKHINLISRISICIFNNFYNSNSRANGYAIRRVYIRYISFFLFPIYQSKN